MTENIFMSLPVISIQGIKTKIPEYFISYFSSVIPGMKLNKQIMMLILFLISLAVYLPAIKGVFVYDDEAFIQNNAYVHDLKHIPEITKSGAKEGAGEPGGGYRPVQSLTYAFIHQAFGSRTWAYHLFQFIVHAGTTVLLFILFNLIGFNMLPSFLVASIYAVHPLNTEAVSYLSQSGQGICIFFILASIISFILYRQNGRLPFAILSIAAMILSFLSHESGILCIPALFLVDSFLSQQKIINGKGSFYFFTGALVAGVAYLYLRYVFLNIETGDEQAGEYPSDLLTRFITFSGLFLKYCGYIIFPEPQFVNKPYFILTSFDSFSIGGLMAFIALVYTWINAYRIKPVLFLGIGLLLLFLIPASGFFQHNPVFHEAPVSLMLPGACILACAGLNKYKDKKWLMIITGALILIYASKTLMRNLQWADPVAFYKNEIKHNRFSPQAYAGIASYYISNNDIISAINYYKMAISANDAFPETHHLLAQAYLKSRQVPNAIAEEYKALQLRPDYLPSLIQLQTVYAGLHDDEKASRFQAFIDQVDKGVMPDWNEIHATLKKDSIP
jgi:hypothetical protein